MALLNPREKYRSMGRLSRWLGFGLSLGLGLGGLLSSGQAQAQALNAFCQVSQAEALRKEELRKAAFTDSADESAQATYRQVVQQHRQQLQVCRDRTWPRQQATWVRLYPCDLQPGILEAVLDRTVNLGYNQIFVEVFYGGQVLLPQADNPTAWSSVVRSTGYERRDLFAEAIAKGRDRGMEVHAWLFTLNFGYSYGQRPDRQEVLARNGQGQDTLAFAKSNGSAGHEEVFIDPYHPQAQQDYRRMLEQILRRNPDGVLFDYVRYPRGTGAASVADGVDDLWIYGSASRNALLGRALNYQGQELIRRYISRGHLLESDIAEMDRLYLDEGEPLWQNRVPFGPESSLTVADRRWRLQQQLWQLSVAHASQGVIDFLNQVTAPVQQRGLPTGAVFFPGGNQTVGTGGFDSRLQQWDRFPLTLSWHPMAYAVCGHTGCILDEVRRVLAVRSPERIQPAIAGIWGQNTYNRPALEVQMQALQQALPQLNGVSHFAYSWQDPEFDRTRKFCQLR
ncbi:hypothetical protein C7271_09830 [filamentous cyanobacterium CCP5]|nr:hypothetical protein C7271_09830 [filamentous cyanobacterium CCP5]